MKNVSGLEYPTNFILFNKSKVRLTALSVLIIVLFYVTTCHWVLPAFLVLDFFLRAFNLGEYSVLNIVIDNLVNTFNITIMPIEQARKRFAAKIGLLFSLAILALAFFHYPVLVNTAQPPDCIICFS